MNDIHRISQLAGMKKSPIKHNDFIKKKSFYEGLILRYLTEIERSPDSHEAFYTDEDILNDISELVDVNTIIDPRKLHVYLQILYPNEDKSHLGQLITVFQNKSKIK